MDIRAAAFTFLRLCVKYKHENRKLKEEIQNINKPRKQVMGIYEMSWNIYGS